MNTTHDTGFGNGNLSDKAKAIFETHIAPTLTDDDVGKMLIIDTETGDYQIDFDGYKASQRFVGTGSDPKNRLMVRVGFPTAFNAWRLSTAPEKAAA